MNKVDRASRGQVVAQLAAAGELGAEAYFPVSARTGDGIGALVDHLVARAPEGPAFFPPDAVREWDRDWKACDTHRSPHGFAQLTTGREDENNAVTCGSGAGESARRAD